MTAHLISSVKSYIERNKIILMNFIGSYWFIKSSTGTNLFTNVPFVLQVSSTKLDNVVWLKYLRVKHSRNNLFYIDLLVLYPLLIFSMRVKSSRSSVFIDSTGWMFMAKVAGIVLIYRGKARLQMAHHLKIRYLIEGIMLHFASGKYFFPVRTVSR